MRATGLVRRMDELGRVVIPKELRKNLDIQDNDPLEFWVNEENDLVLRKYKKDEENTDRARLLKMFGQPAVEREDYIEWAQGRHSIGVYFDEDGKLEDWDI